MSKGVSKRYYKDEQSLLFIGSRIREIRLSKNITIGKLAIDCDVDYSQIGRMELGKINFSVSMLCRIAKVLQADPKDLLPPLEQIS